RGRSDRRTVQTDLPCVRRLQLPCKSPIREPPRVRNAECGMRNRSRGGRAHGPALGIELALQFRTPHSAFRTCITVPSPVSARPSALAPLLLDRHSPPPTCRPARDPPP